MEIHDDYLDHRRGEDRSVGEESCRTVVEAKAKFSKLVETSRSKGPQTITRNGRQTAVVVSIEEWEQKTRRQGSLVEFLAQSPLAGSGLDVVRDETALRPLDL